MIGLQIDGFVLQSPRHEIVRFQIGRLGVYRQIPRICAGSTGVLREFAVSLKIAGCARCVVRVVAGSLAEGKAEHYRAADRHETMEINRRMAELDRPAQNPSSLGDCKKCRGRREWRAGSCSGRPEHMLLMIASNPCALLDICQDLSLSAGRPSAFGWSKWRVLSFVFRVTSGELICTSSARGTRNRTDVFDPFKRPRKSRPRGALLVPRHSVLHPTEKRNGLKTRDGIQKSIASHPGPTGT
jgi:hypothetical protein